jgi:hypothetical protein
MIFFDGLINNRIAKFKSDDEFFKYLYQYGLPHHYWWKSTVEILHSKSCDYDAANNKLYCSSKFIIVSHSQMVRSLNFSSTFFINLRLPYYSDSIFRSSYHQASYHREYWNNPIAKHFKNLYGKHFTTSSNAKQNLRIGTIDESNHNVANQSFK